LRSTPHLFGAKRNLECGDKSRAVRGSRHRFPSALRAEHGGVKRRPDEQTLVPPGALKAVSRGIPLAAALQIRSLDPQSIGIEINCSF